MTNKILLLMVSCSLFAAVNVPLTVFPKHMQLFARDSLDSGTVRVAGMVTTTGKDSAIVRLYRNNTLVTREAVELNYEAVGAPFDLSLKIYAELAQYKIALFIDSDSVTQADSLVCGDAYILDGQSNAAAEAYTGYNNAYIRSFGAQQFDATNIDTGWGTAEPAPQINWQRKNVIGVLGMAIARRIVEDGKIPVAIFNGAVAGTPITYHFRDTSLASIYGRLLFRVVHAGLQTGLRGVIWHQGEASYSGPELYMTHFKQLHNEWMADFPGIQRFFVFQIRPGCNYDGQDIIRESQREFPDTLTDVRVMSTTNIPTHDGCHYDSSGYRSMGERMACLVKREFYGSTGIIDVDPPNILSAKFSDSEKRIVNLKFTQAVRFNADTMGHVLAEGFALGNNWHMVDSLTTDTIAQTVTLYLKTRCDSSTVSYTPDRFYTGTTTVYEGPWLFNSRGVGALTFYRFPVSENTPSEPVAPDAGNLALTAEPTPFNPFTVISYSAKAMPEAAPLILKIYDIRGTLIKELINEFNAPGAGRVAWNGMNDFGKRVSSGIYLVSLSKGKNRIEKRVVYCR